MANNNKKKLKEARKQLTNANIKAKTETRDTISLLSKFKDRIKEIKDTVSTNGKREYSNIADEHIPLSLASEYIPLLDIEKGIIKTTDGRFLKIIQIMPVNYNLKAEIEKEKIIMEYQQYLRVAPSKFQIKCISKQSSVRKLVNRIDVDKAMETQNSALDFYDDQKRFISDIARGEAISRTFYMIIEYQPESRLSAGDFNTAKKQLDDAEATAKKYLSRCGNKVYDFSETPSQSQIEILYSILNRNISTEIPFEIHAEDFEDRWLSASSKNINLETIRLREYISPNKIDFSNNKYVIVDGVYMSAIAIASNGYLTDVPDAWISRLTNLGEGIDVDIHVRKEDKRNISEKVYRTGKFKRLRLNDANSIGNESQKVDSLMDSVQSSQYIRQGLKAGQDFFWVNTIIYITARTEEAWEYKVNEVKKYLKSCEFKINTLMNLQEDAFFSYLPFCNLEKKIFKSTKQNVLTEGLASFYPFTSYEMTAEEGILFGIAEQNNSMVTLDTFDTKVFSNANIVILGTSGAGKSYTLQLIAIRQRLKHIPICIIAPEKGFEFARLCEKFGGEFISISPSSNKNINIMEIREKDNEASKYIDGVAIESSLLVEKIQSLLIFFSIVIPDITYEEKQILDDAIVNTYHDFKIFQNNESLYVRDENGNKIINENTGKYKLKKMPILGDLYERIEKKEECKRMATIIRRLVYGSAKNFNQQTNVNLDNEFTVIDVSNLTGDMLLVGMYIALDYACSKAKEDRTAKKTIIIDELWKLLGASSNELAASYVLNLYKTIRGYGGSVIGATQNLSDFRALENGKYGKGIINNSEIKIVLKLKPDEIKEVQEALGLTDDEATRTQTLEHQAMLIANSNNIVVNIKASQMEHRCITSDRRDLKRIAEANMKQAK
jgi:hypothetical protein